MTKIIVILGPTGVGKTELSVRLARSFKGEIINADSRQVYRELNIGVSKPSKSFFREVPHHLFNYRSISKPWDAASFRQEASLLIQEIAARSHLPFVVGGTGFYIRALLFGLFEGPPAHPEMRKKYQKRVEEEGIGPLYGELQRIDPEACRIIHPHDIFRIIRALEVYEMTKIPISRHQKDHRFQKPQYDYLKIGLTMDRAVLYQKIESKVDEMIESGLENEVKELIQSHGSLFLLEKAIGYQEWFPYLKGEISKDEVICKIKQNTRHYAKRQLTWFRREKDIHWFEHSQYNDIEEAVKKFSIDKKI